MAHIIIETDKSQKLHLPSWRCRSVSSSLNPKIWGLWQPQTQEFPIQGPSSLRPRESRCFNLNLKPGTRDFPLWKQSSGEILFLFRGMVKLFVLFWPSTDWMRPSHIMKFELLYSVSWFKSSSHHKTPLQKHPA